MLMFNKKVSAHEACNLGLVTEVFPDHSFQDEVWKRVEAYSKLPKGVSSLTYIQLFYICELFFLTDFVQKNFIYRLKELYNKGTLH